MSSRSVVRIAGDELAMRPRNYAHLQGLAARYAQTRLDGRAVVNRATRGPIFFDWSRGLKGAVAPGTAPELLLLLPALPALLADARYLGADLDPQQRAGVRRVHGFGATVDVTGRPIELWLVAREERKGRLAFDRIVPRCWLVAPTEDGGVLPNGSEARSRALRLVLGRAASPMRRQEGGATPDAANDDDNAEVPTGSSSDATFSAPAQWSVGAPAQAAPEQLAAADNPLDEIKPLPLVGPGAGGGGGGWNPFSGWFEPPARIIEPTSPASEPLPAEPPLAETPPPQAPASQPSATDPGAARARTPKGYTPLDQLPPGSAGGPGAGQRFTHPRSYPPGTRCTYCGKVTVEEPDPDKLHRDHIIPKSRGGNDSPENETPACRWCNLDKGASTNPEWYGRRCAREDQCDGR
jgi:hypothetical protein